MPTIEKAIAIASEAHAGTVDRQGEPYILHPLRVMAGVDSIDAKIVAVLHDVVEDTPITLEQLRNHGFSETILQAIDAVTHREGESYIDYVLRCKSNVIACQVKCSDLRDNSRIDRVGMDPSRVQRYARRWVKYVLAFEFLRDILTEDEYRAMAREADS